MITTDHQNGISTITINRPDKANALTPEMLHDLIASVDISCSKGSHALVLTGAGKVFSAGADLVAAQAGLATSPLWGQLSAAISDAKILTIAALNGTLAGGAFGMALACDIRLCVPSARFFYPVMKLGYLPQPADPPRLRALIGPSRSAMILMAGQKIDASEALGWGLVDRIVDPSDLISTAYQLAADAQIATPAHIAGIKAMI